MNAAGALFDVEMRREIRRLDRTAIERALGALPAGVEAVAHESSSTLKNAGAAAWRPESGVPSLWVLSMLPPGPRTTLAK